MKKLTSIATILFITLFSFQIIAEKGMAMENIDWSQTLKEYEIPTVLKHELLRPYFEKVEIKGNVLDAGCGKGHFARILCERGHEVFGIDINGNLEDYFHFHFQKANIISFKTDRKFETILLINVLSCVSFQERLLILRNLKSLKTEDGSIYVLNTNTDLLNVDFESELLSNRRISDDKVHLKLKKIDGTYIEFDDYLITKRELDELCKSSDLQIVNRIDFQPSELEKPFYEMYILR